MTARQKQRKDVVLFKQRVRDSQRELSSRETMRTEETLRHVRSSEKMWFSSSSMSETVKENCHHLEACEWMQACPRTARY
jgi:hypothetical protein